MSVLLVILVSAPTVSRGWRQLSCAAVCALMNSRMASAWLARRSASLDSNVADEGRGGKGTTGSRSLRSQRTVSLSLFPCTRGWSTGGAEVAIVVETEAVPGVGDGEESRALADTANFLTGGGDGRRSGGDDKRLVGVACVFVGVVSGFDKPGCCLDLSSAFDSAVTSFLSGACDLAVATCSLVEAAWALVVVACDLDTIGLDLTGSSRLWFNVFWDFDGECVVVVPLSF